MVEIVPGKLSPQLKHPIGLPTFLKFVRKMGVYMQFRSYLGIVSLAVAIIICLGADSSLLAQGRGGGRPAGTGQPTGNPGVGRGLGTASTMSNGRSDTGLGNASTRSNGRSDSGLNTARNGGRPGDLPPDNELNRYRGISKKLGSTPAEMKAAYEAALATNPNLKFGQFVAANVVADNLGGRNSKITSSAIFAGLANGDSLGKTLQNLGVLKEDAKRAEKDANRKINEMKGQNK
jgi:hypothetical protein